MINPVLRQLDTPLRHLYRVVMTGSAFLFFFFGGTLLAYLLLPLVRMKPGTPEEKAARCRQWVSDSWIFFHDYMRWLGLIDYDSRWIQVNLPPGPVVVVANHPTLIDVTAMISAWSRLVCVAKTSHFKSPLIGRLLRYCGYIDGGDGGLFSSAQVITKSVEALERGQAILIFPEGTRSPMRGLREFRRGAFEMAARAKAPILPVFVTCDPPTLMKGQPWWEVPRRMVNMTVTPLPLIPVPPADPEAAAKELKREYQARLDAFLASCAAKEAELEGPPAELQAG